MTDTGERETGSLLVLGLGNVLCGDDGVGVVAAEELARRFAIPPGVRVLDGGTLGLSLMSHIGAGDDLLILDAIRAEAPPGTLVRLEGEDVAPAVRHRLSVHQIGVADLLDGLRLVGGLPRRLVLVGLVPATLELGLGLSPAVAAAMPDLLAAAVEEARRLGWDLRPGACDETLLPRPGRVVSCALGL
jgi:hydrogenase maturation protease